MTLSDSSTLPGYADPLSGGFLEATTTGYGYNPGSALGVDSVSVSTPAAAPGASGTTVVWALIILIVALIIGRVLERDERAGELAHVRISVRNWVVVTAMAVAGIVSGKALLNQWPGSDNPVTQVFNAA